jgi:AcrR family transcriptional regulator
MEKTKRKEMEFQMRRSEILNAAVKIFASKGFYTSTMAEISDASGFAIGTLYQFFESKENLYTTMICEKLDMMYSGIREKVDGAEHAIDKIETLIKSYFDYVENNIDFCNLFIRGEGTIPSEAKTQLREKVIKDYLNHMDFIEGIMRLGMDTAYLRVLDPRIMAFSLFGVIRAHIVGWMLENHDYPLSDKVECVLQIFLRGVGAEVRE